MSDSESFSSDDDEFFTTDFPESIPEDSDSSDGEDDSFYSYDISGSTLTLDDSSSFSSWKIAFQHIKQWAHQQGFFIRKGRSEKVQSERRKQTIVSVKLKALDLELR
ncbi:7356_t:CDS:1 [Funneliformis geosporum]|nr:7356_t:CDS:1 [Funneliformis geosporum]